MPRRRAEHKFCRRGGSGLLEASAAPHAGNALSAPSVDAPIREREKEEVAWLKRVKRSSQGKKKPTKK